MSRVMHWIDQELTKDAKLASSVESELARLRLEQDLVVLREQRGISQRQLARIVGVSQPVIARIQRGIAGDLERVAQGDHAIATEREAPACRQCRHQASLGTIRNGSLGAGETGEQ